MAELTGADAIHPGVGFLAENQEFAEMVEAHDLIFVGPSPKHLGLMGDKIAAKQAAIEAGLPVVPGSTARSPTSTRRASWPVTSDTPC